MRTTPHLWGILLVGLSLLLTSCGSGGGSAGGPAGGFAAGTALNPSPFTSAPGSPSTPADTLPTTAPPSNAWPWSSIPPAVPSVGERSFSFLYSGSNPVQTGVAPGTIRSVQATCLRGRLLSGGAVVPGSAKTSLSPVNTASAPPLAGATITVLHHPEFGQTTSQSDGTYALAVNGGTSYTLHFSRDGFPLVQRTLTVPIQDWVNVPDVVLTPLDANVTLIDFSRPIEVARGSAITDADGTRTATLLFSAGTTVTMTMPDGSTKPLSGPIHVRATEFTVGANGPAAMPGTLPPSSGYTYCAKYSVDEAMTAGAVAETYSQPVISYQENFLGMPVGGAVPSGYYDVVTGTWQGMPNGRVVKVLSIAGGAASLDIDGSGTAASAAAMAALGISDGERQTLATLYPRGQSLWRVPLTHFSAVDCNWPYRPVNQAAPRAIAPLPTSVSTAMCNNQSGCGTLNPENMTLGDDVGITGSLLYLHYESGTMPGNASGRTIRLAVTDGTLPDSLLAVEVLTTVAGVQDYQVLPAAPNQQYVST